MQFPTWKDRIWTEWTKSLSMDLRVCLISPLLNELNNLSSTSLRLFHFVSRWEKVFFKIYSLTTFYSGMNQNPMRMILKVRFLYWISSLIYYFLLNNYLIWVVSARPLTINCLLMPINIFRWKKYFMTYLRLLLL